MSNVKSKKVTKGNKNVKSQKELLKEQNDVLNATSNLSLDDVLKNKLDALNKIDTSKIKVSEKNIKGKRESNMFNYSLLIDDIDKLDAIDLHKKKKSIRMKSQKFNRNIMESIILYKNEKRNEELIKSIKLFNDNYKKVYQLNDYSLNSFCSNNSDDRTKQLCKLGLEIILIMK